MQAIIWVSMLGSLSFNKYFLSMEACFNYEVFSSYLELFRGQFINVK